MQIPHHIPFYRPSIRIARRYIGAKRFGHQLQTMIVNQVRSHLFCLLVFTYHQVALDKQLHAGFLVDGTNITDFALWRHVLYGKLQVVYQHLEDGFLAGRLIVLFRHLNQFGNQRYIAKQQYTVIVSIRTMEIGAP